MIPSRVLGVLVVVAIGWMPLAAPEHVHEDHADHHLVVHRHAAAHLLSHHPTGHASHAIDDDDGPLLTIDAVYLVPTASTLAGYPAIVQLVTVEPPVAEPVHRTREFIQRFAHGPPRATASLRAPPVFA